MNLTCPHCGQALEAEEEWVGHALECPACKKSFMVMGDKEPPAPARANVLPAIPSKRSAPASRPGWSAPPPAVTRYVEVHPRSRGGGCGLQLLGLLIVAAASFGFMMYRYNESPQQVWKNRLQPLIQKYTQSAPTPTPAPTPEPTPTPEPAAPEATPEPTPEATATPEAVPEATVAPTPEQDPLTWLREHPTKMPKELTLTKPAEFPAMFNGEVVGKVKATAGRKVKFVRFMDIKTITVEYSGGTKAVPIADTDLFDQLKKVMESGDAPAEQSGFPGAPAAPATEAPATAPAETPGSPFGE